VIVSATLVCAACQNQNKQAESNSVDQSKTFNIADFGGVGDGKTMNTEAFHKAFLACATAGGGKVEGPAGTWLTGPIALVSGADLHVDAGAKVLFSRRLDDYPLVLTNFEGRQTVECSSPLTGENLRDISITGPGVIDGQGDAWRQVKKSKVTD